MGRLTYLAMLLPWALFVLAIQWAAGLPSVRRRLRVVLVATLVPTAYLIAADSYALSQGIWAIHDDRIIGVRLGNVPVEECLFFLATNLVVVQSIILLTAPESRDRMSRLLRRRRGRRTQPRSPGGSRP
ncbi:MAG: lycopene cyclase domain-containing protein [Candidatus Dormibacteria bacterium]